MRALAALVALCLLTLAVVAAVEILAAWAGQGSWVIPRQRWLDELRTRSWDDPWVRAAFGAAGMIGLALFLSQLWPRRPAALAVRAEANGQGPVQLQVAGQQPPEAPVRVEADIERRALESRLARAAHTVDGVRKARAKVRRRDVVVEVDTRRKYSSLEGSVRERVVADLERVHLQRPLDLRVRVRRV
jgi:hypothetical protein